MRSLLNPLQRSLSSLRFRINNSLSLSDKDSLLRLWNRFQRLAQCEDHWLLLLHSFLVLLLPSCNRLFSLVPLSANQFCQFTRLRDNPFCILCLRNNEIISLKNDFDSNIILYRYSFFVMFFSNCIRNRLMIVISFIFVKNGKNGGLLVIYVFFVVN